MADLKKIKLPSGEELNIKDYRIPGVDSTPTSGSSNIVTSGGVYSALNEDAEVTAAALNDLNDRVEDIEDSISVIDSEPTNNSTNLVTSGGVYNSLRTDNIKPIDSKTFTGVGATSSTVNTLFPFVRIIPTDWDEPIILRYRLEAYVDGHKDLYYSKHDCVFTFFHEGLPAYSVTNYIGSTSYRPVYYHSMMRCKTGYDSIGHLIGINFYATGSSYSRACTTSGYQRTFVIDILEADNCTITWLDAMETVSSTNVSGYVAGTTHGEIANYSANSQGETHTGDQNTNTQVRQYQYGDNAAGEGTKYPILTRYALTNKDATYDTNYSKYHTGATVDTSTGGIEAPSFKKTGGTSSQFLKADGSVDSNTYATTSQIPDTSSFVEVDSNGFINNQLNGVFGIKDGNGVYYGIGFSGSGDANIMTDDLYPIGNATITIQMNGSTVDSFTTNAGSNKTINLGTVATSDTKNTAGSTDTSTKIYLIGAASQEANPQTYSDDEVYATSGVLTTKSVQVGGTAATMQYNSTDQCIEFIFS